MPPESSVYGLYADDIFAYLTTKMYDVFDNDLILLLGDFNRHIGARKDSIEGVDDIPCRTSIDETVNDHGKSLLNLLIQTKSCVLNGQVNPLSDNYTTVSH